MIGQRTIDACVALASPHSDRGVEGLTEFAKVFVEAHASCPGSPSLEVGTRNGGSALMFLKLLEVMYPGWGKAPFLFTVDPYGAKPYNGGDVNGAPLYGNVNYAMAKQLLAPFVNHAHFYMTSFEFIQRCLGMPYWQPGEGLAQVTNVATGQPAFVSMGEEKRVGMFAFCLLDGDHDHKTIKDEVENLDGDIRIGGAIVIDNVDADPKTRPWLERCTSEMVDDFSVSFSNNGQWAVLRRIS